MMETLYPFSEDAEKAIIGAVIINPQLYFSLALEPAHFYIHKHKFIWSSLGQLIKQDIKPDFVTLTDKLRELGKLEEIGGLSYVASLVNLVPSSMAAKDYADILRKYYYRRCVLETSTEMAAAASKDTLKLEEIEEKVTLSLQSLQNKRGRKREIRHVAEVIKEVYDDVETAYEKPNSVWGMATGYQDFDALTGGIQDGDVIFFIGSPGAGKSILTLNIGMGLLANNYPGALFSLEMKDKSQVMRALSAHGKIETRKLKTGKMSADDWTAFNRSVEYMSQTLFYVSDEMLTIPQLRADIRYLKTCYGIRWIILDYLWLLRGYNNLRETERSSALSREVKDVIKSEEVAGLVINAVIKSEYSSGDRDPNMGDMRGSALVAHDADIIAHVRRKEEDILRLFFTKLRDVPAAENSAVDLIANKFYPAIKTPTGQTVFEGREDLPF